MSTTLKVNVARPNHHTSRNVKCNNKEYIIPFPLEAAFLQITQQITFAQQSDVLLSVLAKKSEEIQSIDQFYKLEEESLRYFNVKIEINFDDLSLKLLAETDKILTELDKYKFKDLLILFKKTYDSFSQKLHSKCNRRIKKYLTMSTRSQSEKSQIKQLIELMKSESTDEEQDQVVEIKQESSKPIQSKVKLQDPSVKKSKNVATIEQQNEQSKRKQVQEEKPNRKRKQFRNRKNHGQQNHQDDWQDIKDAKQDKRKDKNNRRKHQKFDNQTFKRKTQHYDEAQQENLDQKREKQQKGPKKDRYISEEKDNQNKRIFRGSKQKVKKDLRALLGIIGDSDDGWRQRNRFQRIPTITKIEQKQHKKWVQRPQKQQKAPEAVRLNKQSQKIKINETKSELPKQFPPKTESQQTVKSQPKTNLSRVFTFPKDGNKFKLDISKLYKIRVNDNFWIMIQKDKIVIQKDKSGYIRSNKYQSNEDFLIEAEDLTISLTGNCNLEDGGTSFENPNIKDFTGGDSQWFALKFLDIYAYE